MSFPNIPDIDPYINITFEDAVNLLLTSIAMEEMSLSRLMEELGCKAAYNLDGGRTSQMYFGGKVISAPQDGGRRLGDIVLIREP